MDNDALIGWITIASGLVGIVAAGFSFAANQGKQAHTLERLDKELEEITSMYRTLHDKLDSRLDNIDRRLSRLEGTKYIPYEGFPD
jgi:hypothetical protein